MSGRSRLPGGEIRKASQKRSRPGIYRRDVDREHAEIVIAEHVYRVRRVELRPG